MGWRDGQSLVIFPPPVFPSLDRVQAPINTKNPRPILRRRADVPPSSRRRGEEGAKPADFIGQNVAGRFGSALPSDVTAALVGVVQGAIYANDELKPAGLYLEDRWQFRGQTYVRITVEGPLMATLYDTESGVSLHSAAYRKVWFADGVLHAPSGAIATLDRGTQLWRAADSDRCAHELRLELRTSPGKTR